MREEQQRVGQLIRSYGLGKSPEGRMLDLVSEVGELSKELLKASDYGNKPVAATHTMVEELGDCLFSLLCLSEALKVDAENAFNGVLEKYQQRFAETGQIGHKTT